MHFESAASVIGEHGVVLFVVPVRFLRGLRFLCFEVIICLTNVYKFLSYCYSYVTQFLIKIVGDFLQVTVRPYAWNKSLHVCIYNKTYG